MEEEQKKPVEKPTEESNEGLEHVPEDSNLSIVEEAKKVRDEIKAENDRRETILKDEQKLRAEELLAGTGGGAVAPVEPKVLSDTEYAEAMERGEVNPLKDDGIY
jgi:hypothetical protein